MKKIIETKRLIIRKAENIEKDVEFYHRLWNHPKVMKFVGFPKGLRISKERISKQISEQSNSEFDRLLLVEIKENGTLIGETKLGFPDEEGISKTDIKLLPEFWGNGFGKEIKKALINYIFEHTDAKAVEGSPNKKNMASIKMQESVGAKKIKEGVYHFPESMKDFTEDVHCIIYRVFRE